MDFREYQEHSSQSWPDSVAKVVVSLLVRIIVMKRKIAFVRLCAVCEEDRFRSSGGTCDVCTGSEIATFFLVLRIIITLVFGVSITARKMQKHMMNTHAEESHAAEILKVLWATYQILASFRWQLGVVFPMPFTGVQTIIGVTVQKSFSNEKSCDETHRKKGPPK